MMKEVFKVTKFEVTAFAASLRKLCDHGDLDGIKDVLDLILREAGVDEKSDKSKQTEES